MNVNGLLGNAALAALSRAEATVAILFAVLTQLGDVWLLFLLGGVVYIAGESLPRPSMDRRRGLFVLSLALAAVATTAVLKPAIGLPRPPGATEPPTIGGVPAALEWVLTDTTTAHGETFPSGHAVGATMVWGGLALVPDRGRPRLRFAAAGVIIAVVLLSRLVLGVHYPVDVLAGAALGVVVLGALYLLADRGAAPGRALAVAVGLGVVAVLVSVTFDSVATAGGAVGGWLGWWATADRIPARPTNRTATIAAFATLALAGGVFGAVYALRPPYAVTFLGAALAVGATVCAPYLGERAARV